jgi:hypothetical protein
MYNPPAVQIGGDTPASRAVDPSAVQILNRSGKGGKLTSEDHDAPPPGTPAVAVGAPIAIGLAPQAEAAPVLR